MAIGLKALTDKDSSHWSFVFTLFQFFIDQSAR